MKHLVLSAALLSPGLCSGADSAGNYAIWGAGSRSCHQFSRSALDDSAREPFKHFLMGYLTAYNAVADDTYSALGGLNLNQAIEWLDDFCNAHAMDSFDRAIGRLLIAHHETRDRGKAATSESTWGRPRSSKRDEPE